MRFLLIYILWIFIVDGCINSSKIYYVSSKHGNDSYSGESEKSAWQNIDTAIKRINTIAKQEKRDVILYIDSGVYEIDNELLIENKKTTNRLLIKAIEPGKVVFKGDYIISSVESDGNIKSVKLRNIDLGEAVGYNNRLDFYCNLQRQPLAEWPNGDNYLTIAKPLGHTKLESGNIKEPLFEYDNKHLNSLSTIQDIYAYGYWANEWRDEYIKVEQIDTLKHIIHLNTDFKWGFKKGQPYKIVNAFSELDSVSEFFLDRKDSVLYWYSKEYNSKQDVLSITKFNANQMLCIKDCKNVIIDGIRFIGGRNNCILIKDCEDVEINNCSMSKFGGTGIEVKNSWTITILGCLFQELGGWGISTNSGNRVNLKPANFQVKNCIFQNLSNYRETYRQAIIFQGCGALISNNRFIGHPSSALRIDANDVTIEYNTFENLVQKSADQGAFDICTNYSFRGIVIRYNYWRNINAKRNVAAVRFDDKISGHFVYGNVFEECGNSVFGAIQIHGGNMNKIYDNVFVNCPAAVSFTRWEKTRFLKTLEKDTCDKNLGLFASNIYKKKYPELNNSWNEDINKNFVYDNLIINAKEPFRREGSENVINNNRIITDTTDAVQNISVLLMSYGINNIPFNKIGVKQNIYDKRKNIY